MRNRDMNNASTIYAWEGINRKGRRVSGQTKGHNPALVKAQLRQQGIDIIKRLGDKFQQCFAVISRDMRVG